MSEFKRGVRPTVAVIGAGFGGLCMGIRLKQAGNESFTIFEKGADVGGIWRDNTYPGCGCDVPSHLYSFSFERYRSSTCRYPAQEEILRYLRQVTRKHGLDPHLRLSTEVSGARFNEATGSWTVTTAQGEQQDFDVVVYAVGQLVPHVVRTARRLYVFQRTASWVIPKPDASFHRGTRVAFELMPSLQFAYRGGVYLTADGVLWPVITRGWSSHPVRWLALRHLRNQVPDPRLRQKLTPDYPIGCKRIGIETSDGTGRQVDAIIYATGFRTTEFLAPIQITGRDGTSLHHRWRDGAEAYLGIGVPDFPNLFIVHGPNTILGHNSNVYMIELQVRYIMRCLNMLSGTRPGAIEVRPEAMAQYQGQLQKAIDTTVWRHGCQSWYKTGSGVVTNPWPGSTHRYRRLLRSADPEAFRFLPASQP